MPSNKLRTVSHVLLPFCLACQTQRADSSYQPRIRAPAYATGGPTVCFDEGHDNSHTAGGLYRPFAALLAADGYVIKRLDERFAGGIPRECSVLVIVNAAGGHTYKMFGLNLPTAGREHRDRSAFSVAEIDSIRVWVDRGGSILLVADHHPYGNAAAALAKALGVDMSGGFTEAGNVDSASPRNRTQLAFSRENHLLGEHPIIHGRSAAEEVRRVVTFTGQSLAAPRGTPLLTLGDGAIDYLQSAGALEKRPALGRLQGTAVEQRQGRVVALGEAAMLTAQLDGERGLPFGMQVAGNDNQQFALNIMHWLTRLI